MSSRKQRRDPSTSAKQPRRVEAAAPAARTALPVRTALLFAPPILTGALLLFAVQPLIARYVLPWFGGGPGVWATCMLFFQCVLLAGYLYAHVSVRHLGTRGQIILHLALLAGSLALIPIIPSVRWKPAAADDPAWRILLLLGVTIGLPYFVLSATSPLLQAWFVRARPGASPYRLFALSNLGSLLALIGYPTLLEPLFTRQQQAWIWSVGLIAFAGMCIPCAAHVWRRARAGGANGVASSDSLEGQVEPSRLGRVFLWLALPLVASVLLLAVTNTLTEDVAATPMLWIVPLALYLLTFVIAFDRQAWYPRRAVMILLPLLTIWVLRLQWFTGRLTFLEQFAGYLAALFTFCFFCHGELARLKPHPRELTRYYLTISLGGALGGVLVAIVAPRVFDRLLELPLGVLAAAVLAFLCARRDPVASGRLWSGLFITASVALLLALPVLKPLFGGGGERIVERSRNFYGTLIVTDIDVSGPGDAPDIVRSLGHGRTTHGQQFLARPKEPTLYYREGSAISFAIRQFPRQENRRIGLVGLGVGTLAAYGNASDTFRFYEIDADIERIARQHFTFLADSPAKTEVVLGDARLSLEREDPQQFDILVLDAFSGDAIPTHLLTAEAFDLYMRHLKPDGVLAVHFSNRAADLSWVLVRQALRLDLSISVGDPRAGWWMLMTRNKEFLNSPGMRQGTQPAPTSARGDLWTDDHVNLMQVIRWLTT